MSNALVMVVLIAGRDDAASTDAAIRAARSALPPDAALVVRRLDASPSDEDALRVERSERAAAVAVVVWTDGAGRRVRLHVHRAASASASASANAGEERWVDHDITFEGADAASERGRTLGFALASMIPEVLTNANANVNVNANANANATASAGATKPPPNGGRPPEGAIARLASAPGTSPPRHEPRAAIDAAAVGAFGVGGYGGGVGARAGGAWLASPRVGARLDGSLRVGDVAPAQASSLMVVVGPGLSFEILKPEPAQVVGLGARINALAIFESESHLSDEAEPVRQSRWLPGGSAFLEGSLNLSEGAALLVSAGTEVAFGQTEVFVKGRRAAVIPPLRIVSDAGIRVRF